MNQFDKNFIEFKQSQKQQIKSFDENNLMYENERKIKKENNIIIKFLIEIYITKIHIIIFYLIHF